MLTSDFSGPGDTIKIPSYLQAGDTIAIVSTAGKYRHSLDPAIKLFESWGLKVILGKSTEATYHSFAGNDDLRAQDLQTMIDNDEVKAVISSRGGYGTARMIDKVNFTNFTKKPKWLIGFSDLTVLLSHVLARCNVQSIHGPMPCKFETSTEESLETLRKALFGEKITYECKPSPMNKLGVAEGIVIGTNLCLMVNISGTDSDVDYDGKILFIEDVGEYLYSIDRMLHTLKRAGKLKKLAALCVGDFTDIKDDEVPFGITIPEMVIEVTKEYNYPVCFNFPIGHGRENQSLFIGRKLYLEVTDQKAVAYYPNSKEQ